MTCQSKYPTERSKHMTTDDPMRDLTAEIFTRADPDERRLELVADQPEGGDQMRDFAARLFGRDQDGADE